MTEPLVAVNEVGFAYRDGTQAIGSVSLDLQRGRVMSVVGPSGCGKSTLLGLIAGLMAPTSGSVSWNAGGAGKAASPGLFTMMFQKDTLLPWLTVAGNVAFGLRYISLSAKEKDERIARLLALGGLTDFASSYPNQLSGGMRRRTAFLSSVAPFPRVLLLDEPFSALDEPTRVALHGDVLAIVKELDMTVLLVTHDLSEAITLSDEVVILSKRPAYVAEVHHVELEGKADVLTLRETPQYQEVYARLWAGLRKQITGAATPPTELRHEPKETR